MKSRVFYKPDYAGTSLEERIALASKNFGINLTDIEEKVWSKETKIEQIQAASEIIYEGLKEKGHSKYFALSHITSGAIATILYEKGDYDEIVKRTSNNILKHYGKKAKQIRSHGIDIKAPDILRLYTFQNVEDKDLTINASQAISAWGCENIRFSYVDLIRGIKIPYVLNPMNVFLLSSMLSSTKPSGKKGSLQFYGGEKTYEYYRTVLFPMIREVFNINGEKDFKRKDTKKIVSEAVNSFLGFISNEEFELIDFDRIKTEQVDPKIACKPEWREILKRIQLYAIINRMGMIRTQKYAHPTLMISYEASKEKDYGNKQRFLYKLKEIANQQGYECEVQPAKQALVFPYRSLQKIMRSDFLKNNDFQQHNRLGALINPYLIGRLQKS